VVCAREIWCVQLGHFFVFICPVMNRSTCPTGTRKSRPQVAVIEL
jgi:hypothetical protein